MEHALPESIKDEVIGRSALPHSGYSRAELERVRLRDGSRLVLKHITPEGDWAMRVTQDRGREAMLWTTGVLNRVADVIEYPVVSVESDADGWTIVMRDVSGFLRKDDRYSLADSHRVVAAITRLHDAFRGERLDGLCALEDRFRLFSPATVDKEGRVATGTVKWFSSEQGLITPRTAADVFGHFSAISGERYRESRGGPTGRVRRGAEPKGSAGGERARVRLIVAHESSKDRLNPPVLARSHRIPRGSTT